MSYQNAFIIFYMGAIISIKRGLIIKLRYLLYGAALAYKICLYWNDFIYKFHVEVF